MRKTSKERRGQKLELNYSRSPHFANPSSLIESFQSLHTVNSFKSASTYEDPIGLFTI